MEDFPEISQALLDSGGAVEVSDGQEFFEFLHTCLSNPEHAAEIGASGAGLVKQNQGVTAKHVELIEKILGDGGPYGTVP